MVEMEFIILDLVGLINHTMKIFFADCIATVPKISLFSRFPKILRGFRTSQQIVDINLTMSNSTLSHTLLHFYIIKEGLSLVNFFRCCFNEIF